MDECYRVAHGAAFRYNRSMRRMVLVLSACLIATAQAQSPRDLAVFAVLKRAEPSLTQVQVLQRVTVSSELDLVIALGGTNEWPLVPDSADWVSWSAPRPLGLFLQEIAQPLRVFSLAIQTGPRECSARILRATATDTVIECRGEKSERYPNQKFVFDVRAKGLVRYFEYRPFSMFGAVTTPDGSAVVILGAGARTEDTEGRPIAVEFVPTRSPQFRLLGGSEERRWLQRRPHRIATRLPDSSGFGPLAAFRVVADGDHDFPGRWVIIENVDGSPVQHGFPATSYRTFAASRPNRVKDGFDQEHSVGEQIGPWQLEGGRLWFGKTFYDGEGLTGVGGFGYFNPVSRQFRLFTSSAIADWSVTAIHVEPDAVWLALGSFSEGESNGGMLRFDRRAETYQRFDSSDIGRAFARVGDHLVLATDNGITIIHENRVQHYIVDQTTDRRLRIAPVAK